MLGLCLARRDWSPEEPFAPARAFGVDGSDGPRPVRFAYRLPAPARRPLCLFFVFEPGGLPLRFFTTGGGPSVPGAAAGAAGWGAEEEDGFVLSTAASGAVLGFEGGSPAVIVLLSN